MKDDDAPKRISGVSWMVTKDFLDRLDALLDTKGVTSGSIARELSEKMGQEVEESGIRALRRSEPGARGSVLVGPLCALKGWPVPPLADSEFGIAASKVFELMEAGDPVIRDILEAIDGRIESLRKVRNLNKK